MEGGSLIRLIDVKPSAFATPEAHDFVDDCIRNFRLRENESYFSFWLLPRDQTTRDRVLAAFASRRDRRDRLYYVEVPDECFEGVGVQPFLARDDATFDCVADFHYGAKIEANSLRDFVSCLRDQLLANQALYDDTLTKGKIRDFVSKVEEGCRDDDGDLSYDPGRGGEWFRTEFTSDTPAQDQPLGDVGTPESSSEPSEDAAAPDSPHDVDAFGGTNGQPTASIEPAELNTTPLQRPSGPAVGEGLGVAAVAACVGLVLGQIAVGALLGVVIGLTWAYRRTLFQHD